MTGQEIQTESRDITKRQIEGYVHSFIIANLLVFSWKILEFESHCVSHCVSVTSECDPISCKKMHLNPSKVFYNKYRMPIVKRSNNRTDDVLENKQLNNKQDYIIDPDR